MKEIVNKFLLAGNEFISAIHLRKLEFKYNACGLFTKNQERIQKFKETGDSRNTYQIKPGKACFQYDMVYGDF